MVMHSGLGWIGPRPEMIRMMGNKIRAKEAMKEAGLPQLPAAKGWSPTSATSSGWPRRSVSGDFESRGRAAAGAG